MLAQINSLEGEGARAGDDAFAGSGVERPKNLQQLLQEEKDKSNLEDKKRLLEKKLNGDFEKPKSKNEKKLKQSCEKYGLAVGEVPAMFEALSSLLELSTSNPSDPAFEAAIAALGAAAQAKVRRPRLRPPCSMY